MGKDQEFLEAARNGNIVLVEKILSQKTKRSGPLASLRRGPGINVQDNGGYSALHYSALNGHIDIVQLLLYHEASPNLLDSRGSSALHLAAWAGHQEIVKMLLTHPYKPANPDMQTMENETPLHCAAQHGHTGALTTLLAHGADPNVCNSRNETPLDLAAQYGRLQAVQVLIRAHPELLHPYTAQSYTFATTSSLTRKPHPIVVTHSALHLASRNGHNNVVEVLLAAGVNVNLLTPSGTALHEAALCGKDVVVRSLLEAGADLNATDSEGRTPLDVLHEFPAHVTKGIISVIKSFRTSYNNDFDDEYSCDETDKEAGVTNKPADGCSKGTQTKDAQIKGEINPINDVSPSVSNNSFERSMSCSAENILPRTQAAHCDFQEFYTKMTPIKPAPKKPPRRNLSISPTHTKNFFPSNGLVNTGIELYVNETGLSVPESSKHSQKQDSYERISEDRSGSETYSSNPNLINSNNTTCAITTPWHVEIAQTAKVKPVPAPRKLRNMASSYENSILKSYNPNRKLKRNRENYFPKGQFSLIISCDKQQQLPLSEVVQDSTSGIDKKAALNNQFTRPLTENYEYQPEHMQQSLDLESGNSSQDHHLLCLSLCNSSGSISSGASLSDRSATIDCVEEYVGDEPFAGLFKGSTVNLNNDISNKSTVVRPRCFECEQKASFFIDTQAKPWEKAFSNGIESSNKKKEHINGESRGTVKENSGRQLKLSPDNTVNRFENKSTFGMKASSTAVREYTDEDFHWTDNNVITAGSSNKILTSFNEQEAWQKLSKIMETFGNTILTSENNSNRSNFYSDIDEVDLSEDHEKLAKLLVQEGLGHLEQVLYLNGYDSYKFVNGIFDEGDLTVMNISDIDAEILVNFIKTLPHINFTTLVIESSLDHWLKSIELIEYSDNFKKHLYNTLKSVCGVWEIELQTVLEINKIGHRKRILQSVAHFRQTIEVNKSSDNTNNKNNGGAAFKPKNAWRHIKKNRPAPRPPLQSLEIRAPSELLIGLPNNLQIKWPHTASSLILQFLKYEVNYLGSTVVKELRGTESTRKSIQKLKRVGQVSSSNSTQSSKSNDYHCLQEKGSMVQLSISYKGVEFIDVETNATICEHEIRNINCACQDADDMRHFAYITKDTELKTHYCHVFNVDSMHLAMEIILTLAESFEVAYQMALRNMSSNIRSTDS